MTDTDRSQRDEAALNAVKSYAAFHLNIARLEILRQRSKLIRGGEKNGLTFAIIALDRRLEELRH
jgi:hypothetical protein